MVHAGSFHVAAVGGQRSLAPLQAHFCIVAVFAAEVEYMHLVVLAGSAADPGTHCSTA